MFFYLRKLIFVAIILFPLGVWGQTSTNFQFSQVDSGFSEFDASSTNFQLKSVIGNKVAQESTSTNYIINQGRTWIKVIPVVTPPSGGGGGGGGSGSVSTPVASTGATFEGRAYPLSRVSLLKDGLLLATTIAGPDARFLITVKGINAGNHSFSILVEDRDGLVSNPINFLLTLGKGVTTTISGIFIAPTLAVDKAVVKRGENIAIFGQTVPESNVTISVSSQEEFFRTTDADVFGVFLYNFDTTPLEKGDHETKAKAASADEISEFGRVVDFEVGDKTVFKEVQSCPAKGDLNGDCRVNLIDFSIAAFWYKKQLEEPFSLMEGLQLNGDGIVDLVDFSIMAFYWTG